MKKLNNFKVLALFAITLISLGVTLPTSSVYALDEISSSETVVTEEGTVVQDGTGSDVSDAFKGFKPVDKQDIETARAKSSWLTDIIGVITSFIIYFTYIGVFLISALDMLYLTFPPVRSYLYTAGTSGTGSSSGMGMGGMGGNPSGRTSLMGIQWVSDEAVQVASLLGGESQSNTMGGGGMGMGMGMGFGGGGFGGGGFGGAQQNAKSGGKSAIKTYVQKRVVFLVYLGVASVLLFTSIFTDFGINVGGLIVEFVLFLIDKINSINIG